LSAEKERSEATTPQQARQQVERLVERFASNLDAYKRACRIKKDIDLGGYRDEDSWPQIHDAMIDAMIRLEKALKPHIAGLDV
jgi:hypothetical protein